MGLEVPGREKFSGFCFFTWSGKPSCSSWDGKNWHANISNYKHVTIKVSVVCPVDLYAVYDQF